MNVSSSEIWNNQNFNNILFSGFKRLNLPCCPQRWCNDLTKYVTWELQYKNGKIMMTLTIITELMSIHCYIDI